MDATLRALAGAVREPRLLSAPDSHSGHIDLALLQPSLRAVAPDLGAVAPVVRLRDAVELVLELALPDGDSAWPLAVSPDDPALLRRASSVFPPLARVLEGRVDLDLNEVGELRLAAPALEFAGAVVRLPDAVAGEGNLDVEVGELDFAPAEGLALDGKASTSNCAPRWAGVRSPGRSSASWRQRRCRWYGWAGSGGRSAARRSCAPARSPRWRCTARRCRR